MAGELTTSVTNLATLAAVLFGVGAVVSLAAAWLMARAVLRPPRMNDGKALWVLKRLSPGDLGLGFEDVSFVVRDERSGGRVRIAGWWIPADSPSEKTVVLLHGYADAKVGAIAWAPLWHGLGFHVLAIDLRAHGESGGRESTGGDFERHDVVQVVGQLRAGRSDQTHHVVLFGISLGATVAAGAAAEEGLADAVSAVVLESPFADFRTAARFNMDALGAPGRLFQGAALRLAGWISGARFDAVRMTDLLKRVRCPVLLIAPENDGFSTTEETAAMEEAVLSRPTGWGVGRVWKVPGADHLAPLPSDPDAYRRRVEAFLEEALGRNGPPGRRNGGQARPLNDDAVSSPVG